MDLSVRIFGLNSWSILVPQALEGVAAVALLYAAVKRVSDADGRAARRAALATTPVAALMFRFDNPDALLVLLMTARRLRDRAGGRDGRRALAGARRRTARLRVPDQDAAGPARACPAFAVAYLVAAPTDAAARGSGTCWSPAPR